MAFLEKQTTIFINNGDLTGLILTGLTENGVQLLSKFIDKTSDIQTAVTLILQGRLPEVDITKLSLVEHWFENYRSLLNSMKLWNERAEFDVFQRKQEKSIMESLRQVHICCTFCSKPIITDQKTNRIRANIKPRVQSCPHCRKPLPRCAICMLHMGTASGISCPKSTKSKSSNFIGNLKQGKTLARISEWFTWCQNCLHGGHADHIINWFSTHSRCPVSGCNCKCERLDSVSRVDTYTNLDDDDDGGGVMMMMMMMMMEK
ncbi:hypothetical protein HELRODRAFT_114649 [Helobdella robusta]|uniref:GATOR2 complex protein MIO zinc-ribbon like domain-containing protein n=1 Tax=Helobdella robusta TaxID=6412 RepID=T1EG38_HELRO|nr:hypothetical protein HELRODRAFT_114649 [Helobdella robusta]ESN95453.1 hypothetical protein HELRODRAFT_114649 [Helobdella robusta]